MDETVRLNYFPFHASLCHMDIVSFASLFLYLRMIMKTLTKAIVGLLINAALMLVAQGCSGGFEAESTPPPDHVRIDGKADEWQDRMLYYRDAKLTIGMSNDRSFLYLCVMSSDEPAIRSIMLRGFTIWFDSTGGKGRYFGIRYPLGMAESFTPETRDEPRGQRDDLMKRSAEQASKLAVIGPEKNNRTEILLPGKNGIEACIGYNPGAFIYELKLPLNVDIVDGLKLDFSGSDLLGVRFETSDSEMKPSARKRPEGGMSDGGGDEGGIGASEGVGGGGRRGGGGGRRGGGGGGRLQGEDSQQLKSIDLFMKVHKAVSN